MKKNTQIMIVVSILVVLFLFLGGVLFLSGYVAENPEGTIGNTAGNINNSGLVCEYDGVVYFANAFDGGSLYSMTPDEQNLRRLNSVETQNILAGGKYLYYFQTGAASSESGFGQLDGMKSFDRCDLKGNNSSALTNDVVTAGQLVDNSLYLMTADSDGVRFYKMGIDGKNETTLAEYIVNPACARDGVIYYNGTLEEHYLYALNTKTDVAEVIWKGNLWYPVLEGDYVYYMDVANNYRLCRYSLTQGVIEVLTNDRVDCFNVGNGYIYYQKNSSTEPALTCMRTDGSNVQVVAEGIFTDINMSSRFVYFREFGDDTTLYHSPLGASYYEPFYGAQDAAE